MTAAAGVVGVVVGGVVEVLVWRCATDVRLGGDGVCAVALAIDVAGGGVSIAGASVAGNPLTHVQLRLSDDSSIDRGGLCQHIGRGSLGR